MLIPQISVFVENKRGRLYQITRILREHNIDIRAISLADTVDFGILRLIVDDPESAKEALKEQSFAVSITEVIAVGVNDRPGGVEEVLKLLYEAGIDVEYIYAFVSKSDDASVILHVSDNKLAVKLLQENGVRIIRDVY